MLLAQVSTFDICNIMVAAASVNPMMAAVLIILKVSAQICILPFPEPALGRQLQSASCVWKGLVFGAVEKHLHSL